MPAGKKRVSLSEDFERLLDRIDHHRADLRLELLVRKTLASRHRFNFLSREQRYVPGMTGGVREIGDPMPGLPANDRYRAASKRWNVVVEVAHGGAGVAAGETAAPVAGHHIVGELGWWPIDLGAVVEEVAGDRVDD